MKMPRKRGSESTTGVPTGDGETSSHRSRALKKSRRTLGHGDGECVREQDQGSDGASSSSGEPPVSLSDDDREKKTGPPEEQDEDPGALVDIKNDSSGSEPTESLSDDNAEKELRLNRKDSAEQEASDRTSASTSSHSSGADDEDSSEEDTGEGEEYTGAPGTTAFGRAFQKIMKKKVPSTVLAEAMGPMLSAHKQLITKKLEESAAGQKAKRDSKRQKQALREKGHVFPAMYPVAKDKELIKLATRGVVKLFNAVSRAQSVQEAAKVSKDSEAKEVAKRSKATFLAMLQGGNGAVSQSLNVHRSPSDLTKQAVATESQPGWSALRDTFMLGKSRLKDWDTKQDDMTDLNVAASSDDGSLSE